MEPPLRFDQIVLNRVVARVPGCKRCSASARQGRNANAVLEKKFPDVALRVGEDPGFPILGAKALAAFGEHVFAGKPLRLEAAGSNAGVETRLAASQRRGTPRLYGRKWPA